MGKKLGITMAAALIASSASTEAMAFNWNDALTLCQLTIKKTAKDPSSAKVPYVENFGRGSEYYFAWGNSTKHVRMKNGLGLEVAVSASCIVDGKKQKITSLTVDGKTLLGD